MRKFILALAVVVSIGLGACSSDDDAVITDPEEENVLHGKWIPEMAYVDALGEAIEESYPHQSACEKDFLDIGESETTFA